MTKTTKDTPITQDEAIRNVATSLPKNMTLTAVKYGGVKLLLNIPDDERIYNVSYGAKAGWVALETSTGFDLPHALLALMGVSDAPTVEDTAEHGDDEVILIIPGTTTRETTISTKGPSEYLKVNGLGFKREANGGLSDGGSRKPMAFGYLSTKTNQFNEQSLVAHIYYGMTFKPAETERNTMEGSAEGVVFEFGASVLGSPNAISTVDGKPIGYMEIPQNEQTQWIFDNWGMFVPTPEMIEAPTLVPPTVTINTVSVGATTVTGTFTDAVSVEISIDGGTTITATLDTVNSTYTATIPTATAGQVITAIATGPGGVTTDEVTVA